MTSDPLVVTSGRWTDGQPPRLSIVVSTYGRSHLLRGLVDALAAQRIAGDDVEVVIVDNGSSDATWGVLVDLAEAATDLRLAVVRLDENRGPGGGRNAGVAVTRGRLLAFTDDDCLPTQGWASGMLRAFDRSGGPDVVQGRVEAAPIPPGDDPGPWAHTLWITRPTPYFETCNIAYRRRAFDAAGGFDETDPLTAGHGGRRAFGEDALLGWRVVDGGGVRAFADDAVVHHRVMPRGFRAHLRDLTSGGGFPGLATRSPLVADALEQGVFLSSATRATDLALAGVAAAALTRRKAPLLAVVPWVLLRRSEAAARSRRGAERPIRLAQVAVADTVLAASLVRGSVRARRVVI